MDITEIDPDDPGGRARYDALFEACPDAFVQQSSDWADVIRDLGPDRPIFLIAALGGRDVAGLPLYLFEHPLGNALTSVPQPGPMGGIFCREGLSDEETDEVYRWLIGRALEIARQHECLSLSLITNPFRPDIASYRLYLEPTYVLENFTQYNRVDADVAEDGAIQLRDYNRRSNLSRNVKRAHEAGLVIGDCETDAELEDLYRIHVKRHAELGVPPMARALFEKIREVLVPRDKARLLLVRKDGALASGCIYIYHRRVLDVLRLNMDSKFLDLSPNFLNTEASLFWARKRGVVYYNWQSAPSREDGVYRYKKQWGARELPYYYITRLLCPPNRIREIGLERLKSDYPFHFVVPYKVFEEGFDRTEFKK